MFLGISLKSHHIGPVIGRNKDDIDLIGRRTAFQQRYAGTVNVIIIPTACRDRESGAIVLIRRIAVFVGGGNVNEIIPGVFSDRRPYYAVNIIVGGSIAVIAVILHRSRRDRGTIRMLDLRLYAANTAGIGNFGRNRKIVAHCSRRGADCHV